jgi:copper homeostasis protein (lipoprotein)
VHWHLDLLPRGRFQLRQSHQGQPDPRRVDDIGRVQFDRPGGRLVLTGSSGAVMHFELTADGDLRKLADDGRPIDSMHPHLLRRLDMPVPIEPRLALTGWFVYLADAASIELCADGSRLPVAMEGDYLALERAYVAARRNAGQAEIVAVQGVIALRPSAEPGQPPRPTLVVERFDGMRPGAACRGASLDAAAPPARR